MGSLLLKAINFWSLGANYTSGIILEAEVFECSRWYICRKSKRTLLYGKKTVSHEEIVIHQIRRYSFTSQVSWPLGI